LRKELLVSKSDHRKQSRRKQSNCFTPWSEKTQIWDEISPYIRDFGRAQEKAGDRVVPTVPEFDFIVRMKMVLTGFQTLEKALPGMTLADIKARYREITERYERGAKEAEAASNESSERRS
jgi:hypothetical protein